MLLSKDSCLLSLHPFLDSDDSLRVGGRKGNAQFTYSHLCKTVRSTMHQCVTCHRQANRIQPQLMGQLPLEHVTLGCVFEKVGVVDYAGPFHIKYSMVRSL